MSKKVVLIGAQWGDEGKGKVVDLYTEFADIVVRYSGGSNAGHTLVVNGEKMITHLVPSGIRKPGMKCIMGDDMALDPDVFKEETGALRVRNIDVSPKRLFISSEAHIVLSVCKLLDGLREGASGNRIGTTKRGIGPTYELRAARVGIRVGDLHDPRNFDGLVRGVYEKIAPEIDRLRRDAMPKCSELVEELSRAREIFLPYVANTSKMVERACKSGDNILFEGAQGTLLDLTHGTYPFVTSSSTIAGGACSGAGIGPTMIDEAVGVAKCGYMTRVGGGPFPTKIKGELAEQIRKTGGEFGATTGRPRDVGWMDLVALEYAARVNSLTGLALTKLDVLRGIPVIPVCVAYKYKNWVVKDFDDLDAHDLELVVPVYEEFLGFTEDLNRVCRRSDLPDNVKRLLGRVEEIAEVVLLSTGPKAEETIVFRNPFAEVSDARTF